jgi:hypothetical protein
LRLIQLLHENSNPAPEYTLKVLEVEDLKHEAAGPYHYFYRNEDGTFVCQGRSLAETAELYGKLTDNLVVGRFTSVVDNMSYVIVGGEIQPASEVKS